MNIIDSQSKKFKDVSKNSSDLISVILSNQEFLRYVYNLGVEKHPLDKSLRNVSPNRVKENNVLFQFLDEELLEERKVLLFFNPMRSNFNRSTLSEETYTLDIVVPTVYWVIRDGKNFELRAYEIAHRVAQQIDQKRITGIGNVNIVDARAVSLNRKYDILTLFISVSNSMVQ